MAQGKRRAALHRLMQDAAGLVSWQMSMTKAWVNRMGGLHTLSLVALVAQAQNNFRQECCTLEICEPEPADHNYRASLVP